MHKGHKSRAGLISLISTMINNLNAMDWPISPWQHKKRKYKRALKCMCQNNIALWYFIRQFSTWLERYFDTFIQLLSCFCSNCDWTLIWTKHNRVKCRSLWAKGQWNVYFWPWNSAFWFSFGVDLWWTLTWVSHPHSSICFYSASHPAQTTFSPTNNTFDLVRGKSLEHMLMCDHCLCWQVITY